MGISVQQLQRPAVQLGALATGLAVGTGLGVLGGQRDAHDTSSSLSAGLVTAGFGAAVFLVGAVGSHSAPAHAGHAAIQLTGLGIAGVSLGYVGGLHGASELAT